MGLDQLSLALLARMVKPVGSACVCHIFSEASRYFYSVFVFPTLAFIISQLFLNSTMGNIRHGMPSKYLFHTVGVPHRLDLDHFSSRDFLKNNLMGFDILYHGMENVQGE